MKLDMHQFEQQTLAVAARSKRVWAWQVIGNAILAAAFYAWLRIPDRHGWEFALTVILGVVIVLGTLWLNATTLAYFRAVHQDATARWSGAARSTLGRLLAFAIWVAIFVGLLWLVTWADDYTAQFAGWVRHLLPDGLRQRVSPRQLWTVGSWMLWICFWIIVPIVALPFGSQVAARGWRGFAEPPARRVVVHIRYWVAYLVLAAVGMWAPQRLAGWVPKLEGFGPQAASMVVRFTLAYLLAVTAWVLLASALGRLTRDRTPEPAEEVGVREPVLSSPPGRRAGAEGELT